MFEYVLQKITHQAVLNGVKNFLEEQPVLEKQLLRADFHLQPGSDSMKGFVLVGHLSRFFREESIQALEDQIRKQFTQPGIWTMLHETLESESKTKPSDAQNAQLALLAHEMADALKNRQRGEKGPSHATFFRDDSGLGFVVFGLPVRDSSNSVLQYPILAPLTLHFLKKEENQDPGFVQTVRQLMRQHNIEHTWS